MKHYEYTCGSVKFRSPTADKIEQRDLDSKRPLGSRLYPWYDSVWLTKYSEAKSIIRKVRSGALDAFVEVFRVFHTRPEFQTTELQSPFDDDVMGQIRRVVSALRPTDLELHEAKGFGRFVVSDHPFFTELQRQVVPLVSQIVGETVEASYNFLSLYTARGVCSPHIDSPIAKWTLDLCIDQSTSWPIYFSQVVPGRHFLGQQSVALSATQCLSKRARSSVLCYFFILSPAARLS